MVFTTKSLNIGSLQNRSYLEMWFKTRVLGFLAVFRETDDEVGEGEICASCTDHFSKQRARRPQEILLVDEQVLENVRQFLRN